VLRRPATWVGAAVVLGAVGSWTVFEAPDRQVAVNPDPVRDGDLRNSRLPTLSVENPLQLAPSASASLVQPAPLPSPTARAIFLEVEPADAQARHAGGVQPADWEAPAGPAWLTGTIEEVND
jgi:hypothetical protein